MKLTKSYLKSLIKECINESKIRIKMLGSVYTEQGARNWLKHYTLIDKEVIDKMSLDQLKKVCKQKSKNVKLKG